MLDAAELDASRLKDEITAVRDRVHGIEESIGDPDAQPAGVLQLFAEVSTAIEELDVVSEELRLQNDELIETRAQIEDEKRRYQELFEQAPAGYLVTDTDGIILEANRRAHDLLVLNGEPELRRPLAQFVQEKEKLAFRQRLGELTRLGGSPGPQEWEVGMRTRPGEPFPAVVSVAVVGDRMGQVTALRWIVRDVSRQKRVEAQLRNLQAELEQRVDDRTHELVEVNKRLDEANRKLRQAMQETHHRVKNSLQLIAAMVDMRLMDNPDSALAEELRRLAAQVSTIAGVHDILTHGGIVGGEDDGADAIWARDVLARILSLVRQSAAPRPIDLQATDFPLRLKQATTLGLVVHELVSNALKHSQGAVTVRASKEGAEARIEVLDEGPGFPEGFDAKAAAHTGLELVENLVRWDLAGHVRYTTRPEGGGRVELRFPLTPRFGDNPV